MYPIILICVPLILIGVFHDGDAIEEGTVAERGQFPYAVHLQAHDYSCGGVILDDSHILTAAHCVQRSELRDYIVTAGAVYVDSGMGITRHLKAIHLHPKYVRVPENECLKEIAERFDCRLGNLRRRMNLANDIAVLTLAESLPLGGLINNVNLPPNGDLPYDTVSYFTGWGERSFCLPFWPLKFIELKIGIPEVLPACSLAETIHEFEAFDPLLVSYREHGDIGGGFVSKNIVYGIAIRGTCAPRCPVIFTMVSDHLSFIRSSIAGVEESQWNFIRYIE